MAKNLIIFDIDGTVTESEDHHLIAFEYALQKMGIQDINTNWASYEHITDRHVLSVNFERQFNEEISLSDIKICESLIMEKLNLMPSVAQKPNAATFVENLWNYDDWDIAFATGSLYRPAIKKLEEGEIKHKPSIVISSNEIDSREGLISAAIDAAKKLNHVTHYQSILSCGDGLWDLKTALNSGIHFLAVGTHHKTELLSAGAAHHIDDWTGITPKHLDGYITPEMATHK